MLLAVLQAMLKFVLTLGAIFGLAFMAICTVLVIACVVRGDISLIITGHNAENK